MAAFDPHHAVATRRGLIESACSLFGPLTMRWKSRSVANQLSPSGPVLEIGCGTGEMASALGRRGFSVVGIEPDQSARRHARDRHGLSVLRNLNEAQPGFSGSVLWHVLEHVEEPVAFLKQVRSRLGPGGLLVVAVPNAASIDAAMYGSSWIAWDVPRHRWHFEPQTLDRALRSAGFEPQTRSSVPSDTLFNCSASEFFDSTSLRWTLPFRFARAVWRTLWTLLTATLLGPHRASTLLVSARAGPIQEPESACQGSASSGLPHLV